MNSIIGDVGRNGIVPHPAGAWKVEPSSERGYQVMVLCVCPSVPPSGVHWHLMEREYPSREEASQAAYELMPERLSS